MSKARSIDGLQRRTSSSSVKRATTKKATTRTQKAPVKTPAKKKPAAKQIAVKSPRRKIGIDPEPENKAVKEFLSSVQDIDPTDLIEVPKEEKSKAWYKQKKEKKSKVKKKKHWKRWVALTVVAILLIGGYILYKKLNEIYSQINGGNIFSALVSPDTPLKKDENGRTNILIFGTEGYQMDDPNWDGGYLTDSMMLLSFDQEKGDAKAISLPRDLKSKTCTSTNKINEVFWCEYMNVKKDSDAETKMRYEEQGAVKLEEAFEEVLGVDIQYHVHVNWQAMVQIVDAIGGIDVVFVYEDQTWDGDEVTIKTTDKRGLAEGSGRRYIYQYKNGEVVHLTGEWALAVARSRNAHGGYGAAGGNFSREYFQQRIIEAIIKKAKQSNLTSNWTASYGILKAVGDNVRTNFQDNEMKTLMKVADTVDFKTLETISLIEPEDGSPALLTTGMINGISYVLPTAGVGNYNKIHSYVKKKLSNSFEGEEAQVVVLNGTTAYGVASNEKTKLEDNGYSVKSSGNAPEGVGGFDGVRLYRLTDDKPKTADALKERYETDFEETVPEALSSYECDYIVVIGGGYTSKD